MSIPFRATWLGKRPCPNSGTWEVFATGLPGWPSVLSCCAGPASNLPGALWGLRLWHGGGGLWPRAERKLAHRESGNGGNGSSQTLSVFCFLGEVRGDPLLLLPSGLLSCFRVLAGSVAAVGSRTPRSWAAPRQGTGTVLAGATGRGTFPPPGGKDHGAQRSGPRPGNEVFALRDKTGTRQCLVAVTGIRLQCVSTPTGHQGRWHNTLSASSATRVWRAEPVIRAGIVEGGFDLE